VKKWGKELNRAGSKKEVQMLKIHMNKCSASLAIKERHIITTTITNVGEDEGKRNPQTLWKPTIQPPWKII
jgi:hypothetical protein